MVILTPLDASDFANILRYYDLGTLESHTHVFVPANTVYIVKTSAGKVVLKCFEHGRHEDVAFQLAIMDHLLAARIPVPRVVQTNGGTRWLMYDGNLISLFHYIEGYHPQAYDTVLIHDLGATIARMHLALQDLQIQGGEEWGENHEFEKPEWLGGRVPGLDIDAEFTRLAAETTRQVDPDRLPRSIIHSDLQTNNLLVRDGHLAGILDWDDAHWDYRAYDIAVFLIDAFITHGLQFPQMQQFLSSYQAILPLNAEERKAIFFFTKNRMLGVINFLYQRRSIHPDRAREYEQDITTFTRAFREIDAVSLDQFLNLF